MIETIPNQPYCFFLGGYDLEMTEIANLLKADGRYPIHDKNLQWGAKASSYEDEINAALQNGDIPVLLELDLDLAYLSDLAKDAVVIVDHHNAKAGFDKPTSLEQVFTLLELPRDSWTRRMALVSANDRGHIRAMHAMGATRQEIEQIRRDDRRIQGVTEADEHLAAEDLEKGETVKTCFVVRTSLSSSTAISDLFATSCRNHPEELLVLMPQKSAFYGSGRIILRLAEKVEGSWYGGDLPATGFWGSYNTDEAFLLKIILAKSDS